MPHIYDVLIFGAGQIAAGYDTPDSESILTHAHAIKKYSGFNLIGFYDKDTNKAKEASEKWQTVCYKTPEYADIVVICTPDDVHIESIQQAVAFSPKLIILEKPIARRFDDVLKIRSITEQIPVQVNFSRRFVAEFQELSNSIKDYGKFLTGMGLYGKGFVHNGSHMIDLLKLLLGEITVLEIISEMHDFYDNDATKTLKLCFDCGGEYFMQGIDCRHYSVFELDLCFEKARIKILDSGRLIQIFRPVNSKEYIGYMNLTLENEIYPKIDNAMLNLYHNAYDYLETGKKLLSPIDGAITKGSYI